MLIATADRLWREAYALSQKRPSIDQADYHTLAVRKAAEIKQFFDDQGAELEAERPDLVESLGKAYDILAKGASETLEFVQPSPFWAGVKHLASGKATGEVLEGAADSFSDWGLKALGKWRGYFVVAAGVVLGGLAIWAWGKSR